MQYFDKALYWLSSGLLIPVIVAVMFFLIRALFLTGSMYSLYVNRLRFNRKIAISIRDIRIGSLNDMAGFAASEKTSPLAGVILDLYRQERSAVHREKIIADFELTCEKDLDKSRTLSKMGPILGLMGTLIPMGPALAGLAAGDIATMSQQMQIAFNTTVMGLLIGSIGFLSLQFKQRWYTEDLNKLEFINDLISEKCAGEEVL